MLAPLHSKGAMTDSPYVTVLGTDMWSIREGLNNPGLKMEYKEKNITPYFWYETGTSVYNKTSANTLTPGRGEHLYTYERHGEVPVGKWVVMLKDGGCIHDYNASVNFHGMTVGISKCYRAYYSGWMAYCADCGELITPVLVYASKDAVSTVKSVNADYGYFYICPSCNHLENETAPMAHICKAISYNKYGVVYHGGEDDSTVKGYMAASFHMYDDHDEYEGKKCTVVNRLTLNKYSKKGYAFKGWALTPGGLVKFSDGAVIKNLCDKDYKEGGYIHLYAVWEKVTGTLRVDPGIGTYKGKSTVTEMGIGYGEKVLLNPEDIAVNKKVTLSFNSNGGTPVPSKTLNLNFSDWEKTDTDDGSFKNMTYTFIGKNGGVDTIKALYEKDEVLLPGAQKPGFSFGGWYYDSALTNPAGFAGESFRTQTNRTLYAKWVGLVLNSEPDYSYFGGTGAVNLNWEQPDNVIKSYQVYMAEDQKEFEVINISEDEGVISGPTVYSYYGLSHSKESFSAPYEGFYRIQCLGASGGDFVNAYGGKGGRISGKVYLKKNERLFVDVGGTDGYNGGGMGTRGANGGGFTAVYDQMGNPLMIAGGGGGAYEGMSGEDGGGLRTALNSDNHMGKSGLSGGGGGYTGGKGGEYMMHKHNNSCYTTHIHTDACYSVTPHVHTKDCAGHYHTYCGGEYYDSVSHSYKRGYCPNCGVDESGGCTNSHGAGKCVKIWVYDCTKTTDIRLICGNNEGDRERLVCGYNENELLRAVAAEGGSSYASYQRVTDISEHSGMSGGNGLAVISSCNTGFTGEKTLQGVCAGDNAPPHEPDTAKVRLEKVKKGEGHMEVELPDDEGTKYFFMVKSYIPQTEENVGESNIRSETLTSTTAGICYRIDTHKDYSFNSTLENNERVSESGCFNFDYDPSKECYIHIAAYDVAQNVSGTVTFPLWGDTFETVIREQTVRSRLR